MLGIFFFLDLFIHSLLYINIYILLLSEPPVARAVSQHAKDGEKDGLTAGFATRGGSRECLFDTCTVHAGRPGRVSLNFSYYCVLNSQVQPKIKCKVAAEERRAILSAPHLYC